METFQDFLRDEVIWFIVGIVLLILEFTAPGLVFFFFGIGAIIVSIICMIFDPSLNFQLFIFIIFSVTLLFTLRKLFKKIFVGRSKIGKEMDDFADEFIGHKAVVVKEIRPDKTGRVEFNGTEWKAESDEPIKGGISVEIINKENLTLKVKTI